MLIYLLLLSILLICGISYVLSKRDVLAPPVVFSGVFIISILAAIPNMILWNFYMGEKTFIVVFGGIVSFCIGYFFVYFFKSNIEKCDISTLETNIIHINKYKIILVLLLQVITVYLLYKSILGIAMNMGSDGTLSNSIYLYRINQIMNDSEEGQIPYLVQNLVFFCKIITYFFMYKFCEEYFIKKIINKEYIIIIIIGTSMNLLKGNRGEVADLLISFGIMAYIFWLIKNKWKKVLTFKQILYMCIFLILFLILFSSVGLMILGRDGQLGDIDIVTSTWKQISIYIGAPLKLLDLYMYTDFESEKYPLGIMTFKSVYSFIGRYLDIANWQLPILIGYEFRADNGQELGNVYTIFKPYLMDFGYIGIIICPIIMGGIYASLYYSIKHSKKIYNKYFKIIMYSYLYAYLVRAFFAENFYKALFSVDFIKFMIFLYIIRCFLEIKDKRYIRGKYENVKS